MALRLLWDPRKAGSNEQKHGVGFQEVTTVFDDPLSVTIPDLAHSVDEERFLLAGLSIRRRLLVLAQSQRGESIRIISAGRANRRERRIYDQDR